MSTLSQSPTLTAQSWPPSEGIISDTMTMVSQPQTVPVANPPRRQFTRQRRGLGASARRMAATLASGHLCKLGDRLPKRAKVAIYLPAFGELPTQPILDWCYRLGYLCYVPVVGSLGTTDKRLRFAKIKQHKLSQVATVSHALGMQQPQARQLFWAHNLDVIFCPLVAADLLGNRMGMGGGYYDTTLAQSYRSGRKTPLRIGWCYDFQVVNSLHRQPWDVPLDGLITPSRLRWF